MSLLGLSNRLRSRTLTAGRSDSPSAPSQPPSVTTPTSPSCAVTSSMAAPARDPVTPASPDPIPAPTGPTLDTTAAPIRAPGFAVDRACFPSGSASESLEHTPCSDVFSQRGADGRILGREQTDPQVGGPIGTAIFSFVSAGSPRSAGYPTAAGCRGRLSNFSFFSRRRRRRRPRCRSDSPRRTARRTRRAGRGRRRRGAAPSRSRRRRRPPAARRRDRP